jgi:hypothetical protein
LVALECTSMPLTFTSKLPVAPWSAVCVTVICGRVEGKRCQQSWVCAELGRGGVCGVALASCLQGRK